MHLLIAIAILGLLAGMLINYLVDVLPLKRKLSHPFCLACESPMGLRNYLFFPRRCNDCGERRAWRTWVVEIIAIAVTVWMWVNPPQRFSFFVGFLLLAYFGVVIIIDVEHRLILHPVSLVGAVLGLAVGIWLHGVQATLIGGVFGFGLMLGLYLLGGLIMNLIAKRRGKTLDEEALGFGDVNLGGVLGLLLGWPGIVMGLFLTIFLGGAASLLYLVIMLATRKYRPNLALPYGPFLVGSAFILLYLR
jgi:leader peptidase (prepilin peptidase)/N-methyltransferase